MQNTMLDSAISSSMQLFQNAGFKIRVIMRDGEPWFVAKDACDCLAIADASQACQNLDDDEKQVVTREFDSLLFRESKAQAMTLISESGLYTLVMRSNKPEAKVFRKWVTSEVLPSIRKTGSYGMNEKKKPMDRVSIGFKWQSVEWFPDAKITCIIGDYHAEHNVR